MSDPIEDYFEQELEPVNTNPINLKFKGLRDFAGNSVRDYLFPAHRNVQSLNKKPANRWHGDGETRKAITLLIGGRLP